jgi:hypothetical protein
MSVGRRWHLTCLVVSAAVLWSVSGERWLALESERALQESDRAFDQGQLRGALQSALRASMARTMLSPSAQQAADRLRAIAVGSEATGRRRSALLAWSSLAATSFEPINRVASRSFARREAVQHIEGLLPGRSDVRDNELLPKTNGAGVAVIDAKYDAGTSTSLFLFAIALAAWVLSFSESKRFLLGRTAPRQRLVCAALLVLAGLSWCIGWVFV